MKFCGKRCFIKHKARQNRSFKSEIDSKDASRRCLMCGKLGGWYCKEHKEVRDRLLATHTYEALVAMGKWSR